MSPRTSSGLPGSLTVDPTSVGPDVRAALTGPDFDIEQVGDDDGRRFLPTGGHVDWAWDVRPERSGRLHWLPYTGLTVPVVVGGIWALVARRRAAKGKAPRRRRSRAQSRK